MCTLVEQKMGVRPTTLPPFSVLQLLLLLLSAFVTSSKAGPLTYEHNYAPDHDYTPKDYSFSYGVKDLHTGDVKQQWEKKDGDSIRGHYSLVEPDGSVRIVDYTADSKSGFNAVVKHKGTSYHPHNSKATSHKTFELKPSSQEIHYPQNEFKHDIEGSEGDTQNPDEYTPEVKYVYIPQGDKIDGNEYEISSQGSEEYSGERDVDYQSESTKTSKTYTKFKASDGVKLPVDLGVIRPKENLETLDVRVVKPIEVEIDHIPYDKKLSSYDAPTVPAIAYAPEKSEEVSSRPKPEFLPGPVTFPTDTSSDDNNGNNSSGDINQFKLSQGDYETFLNDYYKDAKINDSFRVTNEEYQKFLNNYYNDPRNNAALQANIQSAFKQPFAQIPQNAGISQNFPKTQPNSGGTQINFQSGFKPILNTSPNKVVGKGSIPNTYRTNIKPATTPGLRNFSSGQHKHQYKPKLTYQNYLGNRNLVGGLYLNADNDLRPSPSRKQHKNAGRFSRYAVRRNIRM